jgi:hypothetical protein
MTLSNVLLMLLGAALVAIGVLASALADRVRGIVATRSSARELPVRVASTPAVPAVPTAPATTPRVARGSGPVPIPAKTKASMPADTVYVPDRGPLARDGQELANDVIAALVGFGYKKAAATAATWACPATDRATIELWTAAALRRARGGVS